MASKALKPSKLDLDPNSPTAAKQWKHWKRTFDNFIAECGTEAPDKFRFVINFISHEVFNYVEDCGTFEEVTETLERLYVKAPNEVFARHKLATRKQRPAESLDEFLEELKKLSKHCNFANVTAAEYRSEMIRDSFINGISSNYIRQRLLENIRLTLDQAYQQARTLDTAQKHSEFYSSEPPLHVAALSQIKDELPNKESLAAMSKPETRKKLCYFCGGTIHANRKFCPAYEVLCHNCNKKGHFSKVCQSFSKNKTPALSTIFKPSLCAITAACPPSLNHASLCVSIDGVQLTALIDSCSSDNFICKSACQKLNAAIMKPTVDKTVSMALTSLESPVIGHCTVNLVLQGVTYPNVQLDVLKNLCSDVILGKNFQQEHNNVTFHFGGPKPDLIVSNDTGCIMSVTDTNQFIETSSVSRVEDNTVNASIDNQYLPDSSKPSKDDSCCAYSVADVDTPSLFSTVPDNIKPIAAKSRNFNKDDREFI